MKQKTPPFEEMFESLLESIRLRHPEEKLSEELITNLKRSWKGKDKELYKVVKSLKINETKAKLQIDRTEFREVEFQIGIALSGEPILVKHLVKQVNSHVNDKRYKKKPKAQHALETKAFISRTQF